MTGSVPNFGWGVPMCARRPGVWLPSRFASLPATVVSGFSTIWPGQRRAHFGTDRVPSN